MCWHQYFIIFTSHHAFFWNFTTTLWSYSFLSAWGIYRPFPWNISNGLTHGTPSAKIVNCIVHCRFLGQIHHHDQGDIVVSWAKFTTTIRGTLSFLGPDSPPRSGVHCRFLGQIHHHDQGYIVVSWARFTTTIRVLASKIYSQMVHHIRNTLS